MKASTPRERPFAQVRRDRGLDLQRAAARLRVNPRYLRSLELGRAPLSYALAQRMAGVYETTIQSLVRACPAGEGRALTTPVRAGEPGREGRGASGNAPRPAASERLPSAGQLRLLADLGYTGERPATKAAAAEVLERLLRTRKEAA